MIRRQGTAYNVGMNVSVVLYLPPRLAANATVFGLEDLRGKAAAQRLIDRMQRHSPANSLEFYVVYHEGSLVPAVEARLGQLSAAILKSNERSRQGALAALL